MERGETTQPEARTCKTTKLNTQSNEINCASFFSVCSIPCGGLNMFKLYCCGFDVGAVGNTGKG